MSSINEEEFVELIDGLEEAEKISKKDARAIIKQFRTLRKATNDREKKHAEERAAKEIQTLRKAVNDREKKHAVKRAAKV